MWIQLIPLIYPTQPHHLNTIHTFLLPTKNSNKKHFKNETTYRDRIPKKQPNKVGTRPQYPYGLSSLYLLPFFQLHTHTHTSIPGMPHQPYPQPIKCGNYSTSQCNTHHSLTLQLILHMQQYTLLD